MASSPPPGRSNEVSPLLNPRRSDDDDDDALEPSPLSDQARGYDSDLQSPVGIVDAGDTAEGVHVDSKSSWYLLLLTLSIGGLQIAWSVELSNGSPYLLSLGISKSLLAIVWIAGPLSGTLVQPYVGIKSDRCRSRWGKRKPFMVGGGLATVVSLLALAWTKELVGGFLGIFGAVEGSEGVANTIIVFAVLMIYVLDFSINTIQAGIRAFIVDNAPMHQQDAANAWASRVTGVGNIIGYLFGYVDLPTYLSFFGDTQFKVLCVVASLAISSTLAISCYAIQERDPRLDGKPGDYDTGVLAFFRSLYRSIRRLPPQISRVCQVQFFAWIGWFPFLFYITTYIGEIYVSPIFEANPGMTDEEVEATWARATRIGTFALFMFALTTFAASVVLPWMVAKSYKPLESSRTPLASVTDFGQQHVAECRQHVTDGRPHLLSSTKGDATTAVHRLINRIPNLEVRWLTLRRAWLLSHAFFTVLTTFATFFIHDTTGATVLVALIGVPWAMTNWAPFALISAEISKRDAIRRGLLPPRQTSSLEDESLSRVQNDADGSDQAGVVLGIHNVAIAAPQVIATLVSSAIFKALQKPRGSVGDESVAWVLRFGGVCAAVACLLTRRVIDETSTSRR